MASVTGKVMGGVVVVEGRKLAEGAAVTVVFEDNNEEPYRLTAEEEAALEAAELEIDGGDYVSAEHVIAELRRRH
ncbi:MAG: hypothetical protein IT383_07540 [Deltaproteobacteria bacterium]|nr:hypothetical protein [Deltaproteobacteria bacterium]